MKKILTFFTVIAMFITIMGCMTNNQKNETLLTTTGQAWVFENGQQKIAFTLNSGVYKNYLFDFELDVVVSREIGFHTNENILYFHADWYDENGNYLGVWGDSLYIAQNPGAPVNLFEYKISGKKLTLIKPEYSYIHEEQGAFFGDVSYEFRKQSFTPPNIATDLNLKSFNSNDFALFELVKLPSTFDIGEKNDILLRIYDIRGQVVKTQDVNDVDFILWNGTNEDGEPVPSGLYFYLLKTEDEVAFKDIVFLR